MLALSNLSVAAQEQEDVEVIIVQGTFQKALENALLEKQNSDQILDAVSAEDLGKLPDISIAEAIARLPGVVANRDRGNATELSIRGLGPNLSTTLLNGREIATGEASRNIRYETYPAELLNGAYVFKSPKAALVEGGVGGTVDLRTIRPLDFGERRMVINARASNFALADDIADTSSNGVTASLSYVDQFMDSTLGLVLAYSYRAQPIASARTNIFNSTSRQEFDNASTSAFNAAGIDRIPFGYEALVRGGDDDRDGFVGALQYKPSDSFELNIDVFSSGVDFVEQQRGFRFGFGNNAGAIEFGNEFSEVTGVDGFITSANVSPTAGFGGHIRTVNEQFTLFDDLVAGGVNFEWTYSDLKIVADIAHSKNERESQFVSVETEVHDVSDVPFEVTSGLQGSFSAIDNNASTFDFNVDLADPAINLPSIVQVPTADSVEDEINSYSLDFIYTSGHAFFTEFSAGVRYSEREKSLIAKSDFPFIDPANRTPVPTNLLTQPLIGAGSIVFPATLTFDTQAVINQLFGGINPQQANFNTTESWVVEEDVTAAYVSASFEGDLANISYSGNIGMRFVNTDTLSSSTFLENGEGTNFVEVLTPFSVENNYNNTLPVLNLAFFPNDGHIIRVGLSKAISRAPLDDLNAGVGEFNFGQPEAFGGNPTLQPFETNQADLTYEWYFEEGGAFTLSAFFKDVDTFIVRQTSNDTPLPSGATGNFTQPVNGEGGDIDGYEIAFTKPLSFLGSAFDDFGFYLNYTHVDSNIEVSPAFVEGSFPLPGLAKNTFNAQLWYYQNGFEARLGYRARDEYPVELGDVPDQILFNDSEAIVDFQMSYNFSEHSSLNGLKLLFQANNITDEPFRTYYSSTNARGRYEEFGARYWLGFSYEF